MKNIKKILVVAALAVCSMMAFGLKNGMEVVVTAEGSDEAADVEAVARQLTSAAV